MQKNNSFRMPAEWEQHERTFIEWPVKESMVWPENYQSVCKGYAEVIRAISAFEKVTVIVNDADSAFAKQLCESSAQYLTIPHNDAWCRDNGPTFLIDKDSRLAAVNWKFNAWGEKYLPYDLDDTVASAVALEFNIPCIDATVVIEGGSIHVDGEGTLLTTEECLLNPNRNPHLTRSQIEETLRAHLNVSKIIWLKRGLFGDETDGHVDNIACFAAPGVILIQTCHDETDPNFAITKENLHILGESTDAAGRSFQIIEIPQPPARYYNGERLTLSYLNFYLVNGGIILPVFGEDAKDTDLEASRILQNAFPNRKIVPVDGMALITEGGNVHCITQQMPLGIHPGAVKGDKR